MSLPPLPNQAIAIDKMGAGPRHAKGGGKGFGTAAKQIFLARDDGHSAIRVLTEAHLHIVAGQVGQIAVASDKVDAPFHIFERHDPGRTKAVGSGRCLALVIPPGIQVAIRGSVTGIVVPKVQAVAVKRCLGPFGCRLGIHQCDNNLVFIGFQQLFGGDPSWVDGQQGRPWAQG